jgi:hypothetical protein
MFVNPRVSEIFVKSVYGYIGSSYIFPNSLFAAEARFHDFKSIYFQGGYYLYRGPSVLPYQLDDVPNLARLAALSIHELRPVPSSISSIRTYGIHSNIVVIVVGISIFPRLQPKVCSSFN